MGGGRSLRFAGVALPRAAGEVDRDTDEEDRDREELTRRDPAVDQHAAGIVVAAVDLAREPDRFRGGLRAKVGEAATCGQSSRTRCASSTTLKHMLPFGTTCGARPTDVRAGPDLRVTNYRVNELTNQPLKNGERPSCLPISP